MAFVTEKVKQGVYWKENLLLQKEYGSASTYGKTPFVPLRGQIVEDNPGILEVLEEVDVFKGKAGADSAESSAIYDQQSSYSDSAPVTFPGPLSGDYRAFSYQDAPGNAQYEHGVLVELIENDDLVQFDFRGGDAMSTSAMVGIMEKSLERLKAACKLNNRNVAYSADKPLNANAELVAQGYEGPAVASAPAYWPYETPNTMFQYPAVIDNGS